MRLLIVEDDAKLAGVMRQGLREHGFVVDLAGDGPTGLAMAVGEAYDAIVLDVLLPRLDGLGVLKALREKRIPAPVLMLSARGALEDRVRGLDLGADDYLPKPFDFSELVARLRAIARRPAAGPRTVLTLADLELDPAARVVQRGGRRIELTAREFALLEYLLRRKGVVVTRDMILQNVWDAEYEGGSNLIEVYINYLRRKVDHDGTAKLIHTVRGVGYVLREPE